MKGSARELADPWYETSTETGDWFYFKAFSFLSTLLSSSSADCCGAAGRAASEIIPEVGPLSAVRLAGEGNTGRQLAAPAATAGMRQKEHGWGQAHAGRCTSAPGRTSPVWQSRKPIRCCQAPLWRQVLVLEDLRGDFMSVTYGWKQN